MSPAPTVSVVIPVHQDLPGLRATLAALDLQTRPADEIIVADSASSPPIPSDLGGRVRVVRVDEPGSYRARNAALACTVGDVVAFTDAECEPAPDWLERALAHLPDASPRAIGGRIEVTVQNPGRPSAAEAFECTKAFPQDVYVTTRNFAATANLVVTRTALARAGDFDGALVSGGDVEWGNRAVARGVELSYAPDVVVRHPARRTIAALVAKRRRTLAGSERLRREGRGGKEYVLWQLLVPTVRSHVRFLRSTDVPLRTGLQSVAVTQLLRWVTLVDLLRLRRGGR